MTLESQWVTSELIFGAYVKMRSQSPEGFKYKVKFVSADREKSGRFRIVFEDPSDICDKWVQDFGASESQRFDSEMTTLKRLLK